MSSGNMWVRFPDGTIQHGIYQGTSDTAYSKLFDTWQDAAKAYRNKEPLGSWPPPPDDEAVDVDVASDYGWGFHWKGKAIKGNLFTCDSGAAGETKGIPDWVPNEEEGWGYTPPTKWWHYFRAGVSVCVQREQERWLNEPIQSQPGAGEQCPRCLAVLKKEV